jgi:hypothetical protein
MELGDFPHRGSSLWIAVGTLNGVEELRKAHSETPLACLRRIGKDYRIELPPGDWKTRKVRSLEGVELLPNIVYFPSDGRSLHHLPRGGVKRLDLFEPNWLATYNTDYDLDSLLFTVRAKNPDRHAEAMRLFNQLLAPVGKKVSAEEGRQGRLHIERFEEPLLPPHPWTALSSGERQMLLLVVYTVCLLRQDGILLIDEPDLHIHIGMVKQLLDILSSVAEKRQCQMIVAGHSQQLWDWITLKAERLSLGPWRRPTP